jgi:DNA-binding PadR family transcriptional regulator
LRVEEIALQFGPSVKTSVSARSSIRRALAKMRSAGLVYWRYWYPHDQGQPKLWKITDAGLAEVERRRARPVR